jgi:hypothetical protein
MAGQPVRTAALVALLLTASGCYMPAMISPEPLAGGDACLGFGADLETGGNRDYGKMTYGGIVLQGRWGFGAGFDGGLRLATSGLYADLKYNIIRQPLILSCDMGVTYSGYRDSQSELALAFPHDDSISLSLYPALIGGTRAVFGGVRMLAHYGIPGPTHPRHAPWQFYPALLLGASIGNRMRLTPEFEYLPGYRWGVRPYYIFSVTLEGHTKSRQDNNLW